VTVEPRSGVHDAAAVDEIRRVLASLVRERQGLRRDNADRAALEANRLAIVYWQHALAERITLRERVSR